MDGAKPSFEIIKGFLRSLKTKRREIQIATLDLDWEAVDRSLAMTYTFLAAIVMALKSHKAGESYRMGYRLSKGLMYQSFLQPNEVLNQDWQWKQAQSVTPTLLPIRDLQDIGLRVVTGKWDHRKSIVFEREPIFEAMIADDCIEIAVHLFGIPQGAISILREDCDPSKVLIGLTGTIRVVGSAVCGLKPGDIVYGIGHGICGPLVRTKASLCQKLTDQDNQEDLAVTMLPLCAALYAVGNLARVTQDETVLIDGRAGGPIWAPAQITRILGGHVNIVVGNEAEKQKLLDSYPELGKDCVTVCCDEGLAVLDGGSDVILLLSGFGEDTTGFSKHLLPFGRVIQYLSERSAGRSLDQDDQATLERNSSSLFSFNFGHIIQQRPNIATELIHRVLSHYRAGRLAPVPHRCFKLSETNGAIALASGGDEEASEAVITLKDKEAMVLFQQSPLKPSFDPSASYVLVGCLGGLGQLFSMWMIERGARSLIFLSRSGMDRAETQAFMSDIQGRDVEAVVVKGDVSDLDDVEKTIGSTRRPIKGVVQAALDLQDAPLETMSLKMFEATIKPRVNGTRNLHQATLQSPLDFFLTWSSWTAIFGNATQANYLASCTYMDAFARYRKSLGRPATSLSLSRIGNLGQWAYGLNAQYANTLARSGFYGTNEADFLGYCASAIDSSSSGFHENLDPLANAHLLAGIEPKGLRQLRETDPLEHMGWHEDQRFGNLLQAVNLSAGQPTEATVAGKVSSTVSITNETEQSAIERIHTRVAHLLYHPRDEIDVTQPLLKYGIDSMVAGELRNWIVGAFGKDISLFGLLHPAMTIEKLSIEVDGCGES